VTPQLCVPAVNNVTASALVAFCFSQERIFSFFSEPNTLASTPFLHEATLKGKIAPVFMFSPTGC
jgi:hypothetical protein